MEKISKLLIKTRYILLAFFIVMAGICVFLMQKVNINSDLTKYLPDSSQMSKGVKVMNDEFGDENSDEIELKIMFDDLKSDEKLQIKDSFGKIEHVSSVSYEENSKSYNKENHTLFILTIDSNSSVEKVKKVIEKEYGDKEYITHYSDINGSLPMIVVVVLLSVVLVIMLIMCGSYLEPFLFLLTIGIAIVLNNGTNAFLDSVSMTTNGICSILQLVLSMDYSIILSNRYRQACKKTDNHVDAMQKALKESIVSIAGSALTTIAGLLALLFMSFRIGGDLGFVLAKGVFFSLVCVFAVLPAVLLLFDRLVKKTGKKSLTIPMQKIAKLSYEKRWMLSIIFLIILVVSFIGKFFAGIQYDIPEKNEITKVFPDESRIVFVYKNEEEKNVGEFIKEVEALEGVSNVTAFANTLGKSYKAEELSMLPGIENLDSSILKLLIYDRMADRSNEKVTIDELAQFVDKQLDENKLISENISEEQRIVIKDFLSEVGQENVFGELSEKKLKVQEMCDVISGLLKKLSADTVTDKINGNIIGEITDEIADEITEETLNEITEETKLLQYISLIYELYFSNTNYDDGWSVTIEEMFDTILNSDTFSMVIPESLKNKIRAAELLITGNKSKLVGKNYSRAIISVTAIAGSKEMARLVGKIQEIGNKKFSTHYYIGNPVLTYEMEDSFSDELNKITIITVIAIFLVLAISFKSLVIPAILVMVIQASVYVTMSVMGIINYDMFFLALLVMQCILMGATVDYAIVFTNYYREKRENTDVLESLSRAYQSSIRTILTSGLIMAVATAILGLTYHDSTVGPIVRIISVGVVSAMILIIVFLPSLLAVFDKFIFSDKIQKKENTTNE